MIVKLVRLPSREVLVYNEDRTFCAKFPLSLKLARLFPQGSTEVFHHSNADTKGGILISRPARRQEW